MTRVNIHLTTVPGEERKHETNRVSEKITAGNVPGLIKIPNTVSASPVKPKPDKQKKIHT